MTIKITKSRALRIGRGTGYVIDCLEVVSAVITVAECLGISWGVFNTLHPVHPVSAAGFLLLIGTHRLFRGGKDNAT